MKKLFFIWLPFLFVLSLILFLSTRAKPIPVDLSFSLNFMHPLEFFVLGFLLIRLFYSYNIKHYFLVSLCLIVVIACFDELIQSFTPGRVASLKDIFLDFIGGFLNIIFIKLKWFLEVCNTQNNNS
jgi:VanZ family protein